ncbi:MAG: Gfo/Idh/MocA family oxidoreductase [Proteobacteria bacterium]|nr:Gfo/Idh/MocA family oxidoreductase [Burkholderiales bacterium]
MIRAAVIGLGRWGRNHVRSVQGPERAPSDQVRFTRAVVQTPEKSRAFCDEHGLALGTDFVSVLADPSIDAVVLATPNSQHCAQVVACAQAGKAVLSEKPLALTLDDARRAVAACEAAGVVLGVGQDKRHWPSMRALADVVASGDLGPLLHVEGHFSNENAKSLHTGWREIPSEAPGASLTATGIHVLDAFVAMFGPVERASAQFISYAPPPQSLDALAITFAFARPLSGVLCGVRATPLYWRVHVFGRDGSAEVLGERELVVRRSGQPIQHRAFESVNAMRLQLEAFAQAIGSGDRAPGAWPIPREQLLGTIAAVDAVVGSMRTGAPVRAAAL